MGRLLRKDFFTIAGLTLISSTAFASTGWVGTADYRNAVGAENDEAIVGPFDTYDFGAGIGLSEPDSTIEVGKTFKGWFQTMVNSHIFHGSGLEVPQLNTSGKAGTGTGFELTLVSQFEGTYTSFSNGSLGFTINSGTGTMLFDSNPNFDFASDSGFADGTPILSGEISGGSGQINLINGYGYEVVNLIASGSMSIVDPNVFNPSNIVGGSALFSISASSPFTSTPVIDQVVAGSGSVMGNTRSAGQFFELDGNLKLTAVPLPTAAWLFLSGLIGLLPYNSRKKRTA
ncbi:MAG: flocculation-associated PEP-CTERM protein PepA [Gammaproteobacteria bacterium]